MTAAESKPLAIDGNVDSESLREFSYLDTTIEFDPKEDELLRFRRLSNAELLRDHASQLGILLYQAMFPDRSEDPTEEDDKVDVPEENIELSEVQKQIRNSLMEKYGYIRPSQKIASGMPESSEDVYVLDVAFTSDNKNTLTYHLNEAPFTDRLHGIGQLQANLRTLKERQAIDKRFNITREDHTKHYAQIVAMTNLTLAIQDPELYTLVVERDMDRYTEIRKVKHRTDHELLSKLALPYELIPSDLAVLYAESAIQNATTGLDRENPEFKRLHHPNMRRALALAYEYTQYQIIYAYLHDSLTTALGDTIMKARPADQAGFKGEPFSEDDALMQKIDFMISETIPSGLSHIIETFKLNHDLLATMVWSLASEGDPCLPGELMKAKRKYSQEILALYPHLEVLMGKASFDHDQRSGTITNAQALLSAVFPGGLKRLQDLDDSIEPIGAIEDRLQLFMFALVAGLTKEDLAKAMVNIGIDPNRLFIYIEEIDMGPRMRLQAVDLPNKNTGKNELEILPVATRPGDIKEAVTMFNILTMLDYQGPTRSTTEALIKDLFTAGLFGETKEGTNALVFDTFVQSTDFMTMLHLAEFSPLMNWMLYQGMDYSSVESEAELLHMATEDELKNRLVKKWNNPRVLDFKLGTLVTTYDQTVESWFTVTDRRRSKPGAPIRPNPNSIPKRLMQAKIIYDQYPWYRVIDLSQPEVMEIFLSELNRGTKTYSSALRALNEWLKPVKLGSKNTVLIPQLYDVDGKTKLTPIRVHRSGTNFEFKLSNTAAF